MNFKKLPLPNGNEYFHKIKIMIIFLGLILDLKLLNLVNQDNATRVDRGNQNYGRNFFKARKIIQNDKFVLNFQFCIFNRCLKLTFQ